MDERIESTNKEVKEKIENGIKELKKLHEEVQQNSVLFGLEASLANLINYSEYKGYLTQEESNKYRLQFLNIGKPNKNEEKI